MTLAAKDFSSLVVFYCQFFEQAPTTTIAKVYAEFQLPGLRLGIFKPKRGEAELLAQGTRERRDRGNEGGGTLLPQMSLCLEVECLEVAIARLTHLGYPPPGEIMLASHGREIYAFDPEGNGWILHQSHDAI
ncbi:MAG: VOC family protein [Scytolyngbya sp. HA4215-MV1]|nr:VOC family protein [Scytolyngbya sp. HA4215-MV1]